MTLCRRTHRGLATLLAASAVIAALPALAQSGSGRKPAPKGAEVYFHYPLDGLRVPERFTVRMGLKEMGLAPAGTEWPATGHHHLLINTEPGPADQPIPADYNNIHLGNGQSEVVVTLPKGRHTLQLLLGDHNHVPHDPPVMSRKITVYVR
ncbi:MAG: DUF4399 domain-containing protein [Bosea sp. (in: a-proteobacteria)]|uniref:DUF4399 domain-containing protein n=1 Tax=Bosea sp. (in: a-proteobacteria) TaxID=1871050 RepID=UPI0027364F40|nr:DUF4399 domain-containing protein [Bosea sp. (in: a-proteobacteria)]MDP3257252.1 DUF4399 domain-containing protein [Bosea sp. (in: a-proteobacteria)]MDP3318379.1 DUF4399 domain-containing protein [Bosea sp. (in: a-proteobacteria)]